MPNRQSRSVPTGEFNPKPAIADGLAAIARPDGSDARRVASAAGGLADKAGDIADRMARVEGKREGEVSGNDTSWRPSGSSTIRGAAADEAGMATYLNNLDARTRSGMTEIFQEHQNDPAALKTKLDEFKAKLQSDDVFPDIAGHFNSSFERMRLPFAVKAMDNQQGRQRDEQRAAIVNANSASATYREQASRAAPNAPETRNAVEESLARDDAADTQAVRSEAITAEQAATRRIKRRRDAELNLVQGKGDTLGTADEVAAYRRDLTKQFTEGKTKLDDDGHARAEAYLETREQKLRAGRLQGVTTIASTMDQMVRQAAEGVPVSTAQREAIREQATGLKDKAGKDLVDDFDKRMMIVGMARNRSPAELDQMADLIVQRARERPEAERGLTTVEKTQLDLVRDIAKQKRNALATDPVAEARKQGLVDAPPLVVPTEKVETQVAAQIAARVAAAKTAAQVQPGQSGVRYLTEDDKQLARAVGAEGGDRALGVVRGIVTGAGADAPAILREIGGDMPELAAAGDLLVTGGPGADRTAREIAKALELRKVEGGKLPALPNNAPQLLADELGTAFPASRQIQVQASAKAIYEARAFGKGIDPKSTPGQELYRDALRAAAGQGKVGDDTYGGVARYKAPGWWFSGPKVAVPANVKSERFRDVVGAIRTEDLGGATDADGKPITAATIKSAYPVRVRGGYMFTLDDPGSERPRLVGGQDGKPLVLDLEGALAPELQKRVPGAYLGGGK